MNKVVDAAGKVLPFVNDFHYLDFPAKIQVLFVIALLNNCTEPPHIIAWLH